MINIFIYNVVYVKCDFSKIQAQCNEPMVLIGSPYCVNQLSDSNRQIFDSIHLISRDFHQIDFDEVDQIILPYVKKYGAKNIRLMTNEDSAQLVCASLREKYEIPGLLTPTLLPFVNKVVSKEVIDHVVRMPKFVKFDKSKYLENKENYLTLLESKLGFPMFAKPIDLVSSIETHFISNMDALKNIAERIISHAYDFEIDEFIDGDLFHCDAMIIDGVMQFFMIGKCSFALSRFFDGKPVGSIPIANKKMFDDLKEFCQKVFHKMNCPSGAYHLEAFLDRKTNEFVFLEVGARTGGALITRVYEKLFEMNIEETNYLIQMGVINNIKIAQKDIFAGFLNFPKIQGYVLDVIKPIVEINHEFIKFVEPGESLIKAQNLLDISCSIIFWDKSYEKIEETFEFLKNFKPLRLEHPVVEENNTETLMM